MHELIHIMFCRMEGFDRFTCPLGVGRSKDTEVLPIEGAARVHAIQCETRDCIVSPDRASIFFERKDQTCGVSREPTLMRVKAVRVTPYCQFSNEWASHVGLCAWFECGVGPFIFTIEA